MDEMTTVASVPRKPSTTSELVNGAFAAWGPTLAQALEVRRLARASRGLGDDAAEWLHASLAAVASQAMVKPKRSLARRK
jgi:hypothetical protein